MSCFKDYVFLFDGIFNNSEKAVVNNNSLRSVFTLSVKYNKLWLCAEVFLFVLVGVAVDIKYAFAAGVASVLVIILALVFRMSGVFLSLIKTDLNKKERLFCMLSYTPKARVQAAIGTIPLAMGLDCGSIVLTVAVISILITAPFGAICIDRLHKKLLTK